MNLADELNAAAPSASGGTTSKVERYFGDQPDVLNAIKNAAARGVPFAAISDKLSARIEGDSISADAVRSWVKKNTTLPTS